MGVSGGGGITASYATGKVDGAPSADNVGGLVGFNDDTASITTSYATGNVDGVGDNGHSADNVGDLVGNVDFNIKNIIIEYDDNCLDFINLDQLLK